ncbi:MAG: ribulose-phosphate 3-epimerase [Vicinamibacteria bacterium]|jgi:ribulose-phosphate 3-epimerase|nr:ribulose-phosphate 3-epimerase [Vicinamibacteria bacterium]MBP9946716.1 ribulose-phosphate 3-epimerase [Vicinamibacteria bacterium]
MNPGIKLAPSILSADFARLGEAVAEAGAAGADRIHVDVMDGHFVPNLTIGPVVVQSLRKATPLPLECHLMIEDPDFYAPEFAAAGANTITVHPEGARHLHRTIHRIKDLGVRVGLALNPATPETAIAEVLADVDLVLVMTVNPGFGGQKFIESTLPKIRRLREWIDSVNPNCELEVDGGIDATNIARVVAAGARVFVAGSAVFGAKDGVTAASRRLLDAGHQALRPTQT